MSSNIRVGDTLRVSTTFLIYDSIEGEDILTDPVTIQTFIYTYNTDTSTWNTPPTEVAPTKLSDGIYYYDWVTPDNGRFKLVFTGELVDSSIVTNERVFYVGTAVPTITLGSIQTLNFLGELDPLYIDPESILTYYAEGDLVEITELVHWYSLEVQEIFNSTTISVTSIIENYITAAVLCELSKIHFFDGGMSGFSGADEFTLGDLQVVKSKFSGASGSGNKSGRSDASSWCELASILRQELTYRRTNMRTVVKGSNYTNPIPVRALRSFDG